MEQGFSVCLTAGAVCVVSGGKRAFPVEKAVQVICRSYHELEEEEHFAPFEVDLPDYLLSFFNVMHHYLHSFFISVFPFPSLCFQALRVCLWSCW